MFVLLTQLFFVIPDLFFPKKAARRVFNLSFKSFRLENKREFQCTQGTYVAPVGNFLNQIPFFMELCSCLTA